MGKSGRKYRSGGKRQSASSQRQSGAAGTDSSTTTITAENAKFTIGTVHHITKAIYGMLVSSMLFYQKLRDDLVGHGFELNPYDPCVANKMVNGKQLTAIWHVDDLKASHKDAQVLEDFYSWIKERYGKIGEVKVTRGKVHDYLGVKHDYSQDGAVKFDMTDYVTSMVDEFPEQYLQGANVASPWTENLFKVSETSPALDRERKEMFYSFTMKALFLAQRARPDIGPAVAFLSTRNTKSTEEDWAKLCRMMKFLQQTAGDVLTLEADNDEQLKAHWKVDASFAVHPDMKSHTGVVMTMGKGAAAYVSGKQKMNTRSSTEAELVGVDDCMGPILWNKLFLEAQGYPLMENVLFQDNQAAILLESNGRKSAGKRSRHLNIRFYFVADQKEKGNISIKYCPTDDMTGDYMTKPTHGKKFTGFRQEIMNLPLGATAQLFMMACVQWE